MPSRGIRSATAFRLIQSCCLSWLSLSFAESDCHSIFKSLASLQPQGQPYRGEFKYFLHIPRTAGRTLWSCFLKPGLPAKRCAKSYDVLRFEAGSSNCGLLSSHDDYSMLHTVLPSGAAAITQLRDPLERILSAYEFTVEVAARFEDKPPNSTSRHNKTLTTEVWPWSTLVPMMQQNIGKRVCHLDAGETTAAKFNGLASSTWQRLYSNWVVDYRRRSMSQAKLIQVSIAAFNQMWPTAFITFLKVVAVTV